MGEPVFFDRIAYEIGRGDNFRGRSPHGHTRTRPGEHIGVVVGVTEGQHVARSETQAFAQDLKRSGLRGRRAGHLEEERPGLDDDEASSEMGLQAGEQFVDNGGVTAHADLGGGPVQKAAQCSDHVRLHARKAFVTFDLLGPSGHVQFVLDIEIHGMSERLEETEDLQGKLHGQGIVVQQTARAHLADESALIRGHRAVQTQIPGIAGRRAEHPAGHQDGADAGTVERPHCPDGKGSERLGAVQQQRQQGTVEIGGDHPGGGATGFKVGSKHGDRLAGRWMQRPTSVLSTVAPSAAHPCGCRPTPIWRSAPPVGRL